MFNPGNYLYVVVVTLLSMSSLLACVRLNSHTSSINSGVTDIAQDRLLKRAFGLHLSDESRATLSETVRRQVSSDLVKAKPRLDACLYEALSSHGVFREQAEVTKRLHADLIAKIHYNLESKPLKPELEIFVPLTKRTQAQRDMKRCLNPLTEKLTLIQINTLARVSLDLSLPHRLLRSLIE